MKRPQLVWAAIVVPLWLALALGCHWEPVVRDGWGHVRFHYWTGLSLHTLCDAIVNGYLHGNPRLGQTITILQYTPGPWHAIGTPLLELAMFVLLTTLALGRWPKLRRTDDALVFATTTALVVACAPIIGQILFYRPYSGNYLFGFTVQLALLVPYRISGEGPRATGWWRVPAMLVLGAAAGMCNEHTPPAIGVAGMVALVACWRRDHDKRAAAWMLAGLVGLGAGWLALIFAPGQAFRYAGLAQQAGTFERITDRGASGDAWIIVTTLWYVLWALPWLVLGWFARRGAAPISRARKLSILVGVAAAVLAAVTLLGSPKEGGRLAFASCALAATAVASWVTAQLAAGWSRRVAAALAVAAMIFVFGRCLLALHEVGGEFDERLALIRATPKDGVVTVPPYTVPRSRWFLGDDFVAGSARVFVANTFFINRIDYTGVTLPPPPAKISAP